jgi:hypothetical protein
VLLDVFKDDKRKKLTTHAKIIIIERDLKNVSAPNEQSTRLQFIFLSFPFFYIIFWELDGKLT